MKPDIRTPIPTIYGDWATKYADAWKSQTEQLRAKFGAAIEDVLMPIEHPTDVPIVFVEKSKIPQILAFMKAEPGFEYAFLADITATDESPREPRFDVVYNLYSPARKWRIRLKCRVAEGADIPTAVGVWAGANWAEREVWDMFGIRFAGHPDLRRILMDERWEGHPLRKDYPLRGYQIFTSPMQANTRILED